MIAVSTDDAETLRRFRAELKAPFPFVSDEDGALARAFGAKGLLFAKRLTYVIGDDRRILFVEAGGDAVDPAEAIEACCPSK